MKVLIILGIILLLIMGRVNYEKKEIKEGRMKAPEKKPVKYIRKEIEQDELKCPKCGSKHITAQKRGYKLGRGVVMGAIALPLAFTGAIGKDKIQLTCLKCGNKFKQGK